MHARHLSPLSAEQQAAVRTVYDAAVGTLSADDRAIPQVGQMLPFLLRACNIIYIHIYINDM